MSTKKVNMFGFKFLTPIKDVEYQPEIALEANIMSNIAELTGDVTISLEEGTTGYDNQWIFLIKQGATAYTVNLPEIQWYSSAGIAPSFGINTVTEVRLCYRNNKLVGSWCPC